MEQRNQKSNLYYVDFAEFDNATALPDGDKVIHQWYDSMVLLDNMRTDNNLIPHSLHLVAIDHSHFYSDDERQAIAHRGDNTYRGTISNEIKSQVLKAYNAFRRKNKTDDLILRYSNGILSIPSFSVETVVG